MDRSILAVAGMALGAGLFVSTSGVACEGMIGTARSIAVDPTALPRIGSMQYKQGLPLAPKEVVLTFDDGPWPPMTTRVLEILKQHCVKATFFLIGRNAKAFPAVAQQIAREGHTVAAHSQTHPYFQNVSHARGVQEIEDSFATIAAALEPTGVKPAPFFRFPGLISTAPFESYLRTRGVASLGTDVLASDWFRRLQTQPDQIFDRAITRIEANGGGILLLHDVKIPTVQMLPDLLKELKERGYSIVHMVAPGTPDAQPLDASVMAAVPMPLPRDAIASDGKPVAVAAASGNASIRTIAAAKPARKPTVKKRIEVAAAASKAPAGSADSAVPVAAAAAAASESEATQPVTIASRWRKYWQTHARAADPAPTTTP